MSEEKLNEIKEILDDMKGILLLSNQDKIEEVKRNVLREGSMESKVYGLCDGEKNISEIAKEVGKTSNNISGVITTLRHKGLIKTVDKEGKKVHVKRF